MKTKEKILVEAMKLFSVNGFEAVSVRTIAAAVGVRDSALYKHYKSKRAIFDAILEECKIRFQTKCEEVHMGEMTIDNFIAMCLKMFDFQTQDEWIVMFRRILTIEQYKNPEMAAIYKQFFIEPPITYQEKIFKSLIEQKVMKDKNAHVMAMELYAPFYLYHNISEDHEQLQELLSIHVRNFAQNYFLLDGGEENE